MSIPSLKLCLLLPLGLVLSAAPARHHKAVAHRHTVSAHVRTLAHQAPKAKPAATEALLPTLPAPVGGEMAHLEELLPVTPGELRPVAIPEKTSSAISTGELSPLLDRALSCLGTPYRSGGTSTQGFDCSGFVRYVFAPYGVNLEHSSAAQATEGLPASLDDLQPGDLLYFNHTGGRRGRISHVGIYLGEGRFIHAASGFGRGRGQVRIAKLSEDYFAKRVVGARRFILSGDQLASARLKSRRAESVLR
nr:C40 family peptidase [uncultured Holophaga sp.]